MERKKLAFVNLSYHGKPEFIKVSADRLRRLAAKFYNNKINVIIDETETSANIEAFYDESNYKNDLIKIGGIFYQAMGGLEE